MPEEDVINEYQSAVQRLADLTADVAEERSLDDVLVALADARVAVARAYRERRPRAQRGSGARGKILAYLLRRQGEWVSGDEIAAVSGIREWPRRVRELRLEQGYEIEEGKGCYRLLSADPDLGRSNRWQTMQAVRRHAGTPLQRVRELLEALVGESLSLYEINRSAGAKDGVDLVRRLRNRELYPIETYADAPDLEPDQYRLAAIGEEDFLHPSQALFDEDIRRRVFARDDFTCQVCRVRHPASMPSAGTVFYLVIVHLDVSPDDIPRTPAERLREISRLTTSCNRCVAVECR